MNKRLKVNLKLEFSTTYSIDAVESSIKQALYKGLDSPGHYVCTPDQLAIDIAIEELVEPLPMINTINPLEVIIYTPQGYSLGKANEYEFNDFLIQVKKKKLQGYHVKFKGETIYLLVDGKISSQPEGFFDLMSQQLEEIMGI